MEIIKSTGISLSAHAIGESDIICNLYTNDHGKRKFIFKGLKKSKKRARSAVEPGAISDIVYYYRDDRDSYIVNDVEVRKFYSAITEDLQKIFNLYLILESVDKTCGYNIADNAIYSLLCAGLDTLSKTSYPVHLSAFFIMHLLYDHGIWSDIQSCKICHKNDFSLFILDCVDMRPVCEKCFNESSQSGLRQGSRLLQKNVRTFIRECFEKKYISIDHAAYKQDDILDLLFDLTLFMENYFHTELRSKSFILSDRYRS